jgi:hypothetical protein
MQIKNCFYSDADNSAIDCEIEHPDFGWIPTTFMVDGDDRHELAEAVKLMDITPYVAPALSAEDQLKAIETAVQLLHDTKAQTLGYDDINSCAKYVGYDNDFRAECEGLCGWAAACWVKCYALLAEWQAGGFSEMGVDDVLAVMPDPPVNV